MPDSRRDWAHVSLAELVAHILSIHHEYLRRELPAISVRLTRVVEAHGEKHGATLIPLRSAFSSLQEEISGHLRKEEMVLFPASLEWEAAGEALFEMRRLTQGYLAPPDACATFRALYQGQ
jgi:regulator of cell morphogenesis and NO signaling